MSEIIWFVRTEPEQYLPGLDLGSELGEGFNECGLVGEIGQDDPCTPRGKEPGRCEPPTKATKPHHGDAFSRPVFHIGV